MLILPFNDLIVVLGDLSHPNHVLQSLGPGQVGADQVVLLEQEQAHPLQPLHLLDQEPHVQLLHGLLPRPMDVLHLLPAQLDSEAADPVVEGVLQEHEEPEVPLAQLPTRLVHGEATLGDGHVVPVLGEGGEEEGEEEEQQREEATHVGQHLVNLVVLPGDVERLPPSLDDHRHVVRGEELDRVGFELLDVVSDLLGDALPGPDAVVGSHVVLSQLDESPRPRRPSKSQKYFAFDDVLEVDFSLRTDDGIHEVKVHLEVVLG